MGYTGTDRSLLLGQDVLLLRQIARDLLHALSHRDDKRMAWPMINQLATLVRQVGNMPVELNLSETN